MLGSGTSDPVISDGQQIQELVSQLSGNYREFYCSQLSQDVADIINTVQTIQAQGSNPLNAIDFTYAELDEHYCVFGSY